MRRRILEGSAAAGIEMGWPIYAANTIGRQAASERVRGEES
jgi:hypothetical protein